MKQKVENNHQMIKGYLPILVVIITLVMSSLACGISTSPATKSPAPAAQDSSPIPTLASVQSTAAPIITPTVIPQVDESTSTTTPANESLATVSVPSSETLPTLMPVVDTNSDGQIDICEAIPQSVLEETLGRTLSGRGQPFQDTAMGDGCAFDFGYDSNEAFFAYISLASEEQYNAALANAVDAEPVTIIGDSAFLNYGPDARQLWIRVGEKAVLVAIGDRENVPAALIFASYLIDFASK
jgi:hypothetical protein